MKQIIITIILITSIRFVYGQTSIDTIYLDSKWEKASKNEYEYMRILTRTKSSEYLCKDYWESGEIQMTGQYSSLLPESKEGEFKWYYKNGNLRRLANFINDRTIGQITLFDTEGNFDIKYIVYLDSLDNTEKVKSAIKKFYEFLPKNLEYPKKARRIGKTGKVLTEFYIDLKGEITRLATIQSVSEELDDEAKRVIMAYNKWPTPIYKGQPTYVRLVLPINFVLE